LIDTSQSPHVEESRKSGILRLVLMTGTTSSTGVGKTKRYCLGAVGIVCIVAGLGGIVVGSVYNTVCF
jgi:hypothetical protein